MNLDESVHDQISLLCQKGDTLACGKDYRTALTLYHQAWNLLPEPKEDWSASTWILSAIGDAHFFLSDFQRVLSAFGNAVHCPDGLGNPFIHLRIGQASFELGDMDRAKDELTRAFMGVGQEIFANEDPKYFSYLQTILEPMPGKEML